MRRRRLLQHLSRNGCSLVREGRRHSWWGNPEAQRRAAVPRHTEIPDELVKTICRQLRVPPP